MFLIECIKLQFNKIIKNTSEHRVIHTHTHIHIYIYIYIYISVKWLLLLETDMMARVQILDKDICILLCAHTLKKYESNYFPSNYLKRVGRLHSLLLVWQMDKEKEHWIETCLIPLSNDFVSHHAHSCKEIKYIYLCVCVCVCMCVCVWEREYDMLFNLTDMF